MSSTRGATSRTRAPECLYSQLQHFARACDLFLPAVPVNQGGLLYEELNGQEGVADAIERGEYTWLREKK